MHILIVLRTQLPVLKYGGTERVMWYLGRTLFRMGHQVTYLAKAGSYSDFARVIPIDETKSIVQQIPTDVDVVHFNDKVPKGPISKPYIVTYHGNFLTGTLDHNAVFVSKNHAERYGSNQYVYNGMDWADYGKIDDQAPRTHFHFLGQVAWSQKNVKGAIEVIEKIPHECLIVMGGNRLNFKHGLHFYTSLRAKFRGMVGGEEKISVLKHSKGLLFPVRWYEPFGIAITESLFCGAPVFGTPYGSLPELITSEVGYLSVSASKLAEHIRNDYHYDPRQCHQYADDLFNAQVMARAYLEKYEKVLNGEVLNIEAPKENIPDRKHLEWEE